MSKSVGQAELQGKTQQLLQGALRHVRVAALAAALVPLGVVAVSPPVAQGFGSGGSTAAVPSPCDFVTGDGVVSTESNTNANFAVHGGCKKGAFWGALNYVDDAANYHLKSTEITGYLTPWPGSNIRDICGVATSNVDEAPVFFRVRMIDNSAFGVNDEFGIRLSNGYLVPTRPLSPDVSGNIDLNDPNPSTKGPVQAPDEYTMCNGLPEPY